MPVKTVTLQVTALTDAANRQIAATGAYFEKLRAANPVELTVKLNAAEARAQAAILQRELSGVVSGRINVDSGGGIGALISRLLGRTGGGAGAGGALVSGGTGIAPAIPGIGALSGPGAIAAVAAGLAALPFLAQAAAGAITFGLGGALTAIGIYAASKSADVKKSFADLTAAAAKDFGGVGTPFNKAIEGILKTAQGVLPGIAKTFTEAITPIAGPLEALGRTFIRVFADKQVADSIKAVGQAFGGILRALTPQLAGDAAAVADGITNIARAVARNPKAIADFISALAHLTGVLLDIIGWLTQVAAYLELHFIPAFQHARAGIERDFVQVLVRFFTSTIPAAFDILANSAKIAFFELEEAGLKAALGITTAFGHLPGPLGAPFRSASAAIRGMLAGIQGDVTNAVNNISADWARLNGQTSTLYLNINAVNPAPGTSTSPNPATRRYASGVAFAAPGWAWVGEQGPELAYFRGGETVIPAGVSRGYAGGAAAGVNVTLNVTGTPRNEADAFLVSWLKRLIASGHLDVQMAP